MTYDLDAAIREELGEPFSFTLGRQEFVLPHQKDVDKRSLLIADQEGGSAILDSLKLALGAEQWERFDAIPLSIAGIEKLYVAWNEHSGVTSGEGSASTS